MSKKAPLSGIYLEAQKGINANRARREAGIARAPDEVARRGFRTSFVGAGLRRLARRLRCGNLFLRTRWGFLWLLRYRPDRYDAAEAFCNTVIDALPNSYTALLLSSELALHIRGERDASTAGAPVHPILNPDPGPDANADDHPDAEPDADLPNSDSHTCHWIDPAYLTCSSECGCTACASSAGGRAAGDQA